MNNKLKFRLLLLLLFIIIISFLIFFLFSRSNPLPKEKGRIIEVDSIYNKYIDNRYNFYIKYPKSALEENLCVQDSHKIFNLKDDNASLNIFYDVDKTYYISFEKFGIPLIKNSKNIRCQNSLVDVSKIHYGIQNGINTVKPKYIKISIKDSIKYIDVVKFLKTIFPECDIEKTNKANNITNIFFSNNCISYPYKVIYSDIYNELLIEENKDNYNFIDNKSNIQDIEVSFIN